MATTILVNTDNSLMVTTQEQIMQHSKNVHIVKIYVPNTYFSFDMTKFTATAEIVPPNQEYQVVTLTPEETSEKEGYIQYNIDITADYTLFPGDLAMELTFTYTDTDTMKTYVRHTTSCTLTVVAIEKWSELIADSALSKLDQSLVKLEADIAVVNRIADAFGKSKADNMAINDDGDLQLKANGAYIGDAIPVSTPSTEDDEDGTTDGVIDADQIYSI